MKNAMKRWLSLLLTVLMVASALPFAALAEGTAGLIEDNLVPVETEQPTETKPTVNVSNAVSPAGLLAAGEVGKGVSTTSIGGNESITITMGETATVTSTVTDTSANRVNQESWKSSDPNVATVSYTANTASGYKATSATVTGEGVGTATITHTYYNNRWTTHTETIEVIVKAKVAFDMGEAKDFVTAPEAILVGKKDESVTLPTDPVWQDASGKTVKTFAGWYTDSALTTQFDSKTSINNNITLYAKWEFVDLTVTFDIGAEATAAGVAIPESITVQEGSTISNLPMLMNWEGDSGEKYFAGWYSDEACNTPFTSRTPVSAETTTLYAKWVGSNEEGNYYVNFKSQDGSAVLITLVAAEGQTVGEYSNVPEISQNRFLGWSETKQEESDTRETFAEKKFDFTKPISEAVKDDERSIDLYAWYGKTVTVIFEPEGGTAVDALVTFKGDAVQSKPGISTRIGYTFKHWSTEKNGEEFDFSAKLDEDVTLYAVWEAEFVKVNIVYVLEKANYSSAADKYELAGKSLTVYAPTGSTVKIVKSSVDSIGATHEIKYTLSSDPNAENAKWENANASADAATPAVLPDIYDKYFQYTENSQTNGIKVLPNGSTVIQAYYDRAMIKLSFDFKGEDKWSLNTAYLSDTNKKHYKSAADNEFTYWFEARYGQDITDAWPRVSWVKNDDEKAVKGFGGWKKPDGIAQYTDVRYLVSDLFEGGNASGLKIQDQKLVAEYMLSAHFQNTYSYYALYARTTLDGENADFKASDGKKYTIYSDESRIGSTGWLRAKALDGCASGSMYGGEYGVTDNNSNLPLNDNSTVLNGYDFDGNNPIRTGKTVEIANGQTVVRFFQNTFGDKFKLISKTAEKNPQGIEQGTRIMVLLYDRNRLNITLHGNDDVLHDVVTASDAEKPYYGDRIYDEEEDFIKVQEKKLSKEGYRFAGWYTTADCADGTQYEPDDKTRIYKDLELWAKWEPDDFRAEFYLYKDDKSPYRTEYFAEAGTLTNWEVPLEVKSYFVGWYYYNKEGEYVPFNFSNAVGAVNVDENGTMKLYAEWKDGYGKVQYLPGEGGLASQAKFDEQSKGEGEKSGYQIGKAMVHLQKPDDVWSKDENVPNDAALQFVGWEAPDGTIYQPGKWVLVTRQLMQFEAIWAKDVVTLTYNANDGNGDDVVEKYELNANANIWDNKDYNSNTGKWVDHFTRQGYELIGWDEKPDATDPSYKLGKGTILMDGNKTLYAIWKKKTTSVVFGKVVTGNMGNWNDLFCFTVSYPVDGTQTSVDTDYFLKHDQTVTLENIPIGATITITEADCAPYETSWVAGATDGTGTATKLKEAIGGSGTRSASASATVAESGTTIIFTNENEAKVDVDTGILLDSLPYVLILALVAVALVMWFARRRRDD